MSILIRGMEMPNHCGECGIEWCERWKRLIVAGMPSAKARPEDCPLVPVPPHGRLIDSDAFLALINDSTILSDFLKCIINPLIRGEPTVIEAEDNTDFFTAGHLHLGYEEEGE